jgi:uncharacterized protein YggT (Ycf19 family)
VGAAGIIASVVDFYIFLMIIYVLMSWFPVSGFFAEVENVLGSVVEPYLSLFRRMIPPLGAVDISPIVAILVLQLVTRWILGLIG